MGRNESTPLVKVATSLPTCSPGATLTQKESKYMKPLESENMPKNGSLTKKRSKNTESEIELLQRIHPSARTSEGNYLVELLRRFGECYDLKHILLALSRLNDSVFRDRTSRYTYLPVRTITKCRGRYESFIKNRRLGVDFTASLCYI